MSERGKGGSGPRPAATVSVERGYRRLLACYPWEHRRQYEDEMLGVLLDDAGPSRRRPPARDVSDLLRGAFRARFRYTARGLADPLWRDAAAAAGLLAALVMLAQAARPVLLDIALVLASDSSARFGGLGAWYAWPKLVVWTLVVAAIGVGWRRVAAVLAVAAAVLEVARTVDEYRQFLSVFDTWPVVLALVAAVALAVSGQRTGVAVLGRRRVGLLGGAALLGGSALTIDNLIAWYFGQMWGTGTLRTVWIFTRSVTYPEALLLCAALALGVLAVGSAPAPVRRRLFALLAPVGATLLITRIGLQDWYLLARASQAFPTGLTVAQWLAIVLTPPLTLAIAVAAVHRRERTLRLLALGRAADRQAALATEPASAEPASTTPASTTPA